MAENSMEVICISAQLGKGEKETCGGSEEVIFLIFRINRTW